MSKRYVNDKVAGRAPQGEDIPHDRNKRTHEDLVRRRPKAGEGSQPSPRKRAVSQTARTASRKTRATPLHTPPGQKRGHNLIPGSAAPHARFPKAPRAAALGQPGATTHATKRATVNPQGEDKRSKQSTAQKRASSRSAVPMSAPNATGAFGKGPPRRRLPMRG